MSLRNVFSVVTDKHKHQLFREILSAYRCFDEEDRKFIRKNVTQYINTNENFIMPISRTGNKLVSLISLEATLRENMYHIDFVEIGNGDFLVNTDIVIAPDEFVLGNIHEIFLSRHLLELRHEFDRFSSFKDALQYLYEEVIVSSNKMSVLWYLECLEARAKLEDVKACVNFYSYINWEEPISCYQKQVKILRNIAHDILNTSDKNLAKLYLADFTVIELSFLSSIYTFSELADTFETCSVAYKLYRFLFDTDGYSILKNAIEKMKKSNNPFQLPQCGTIGVMQPFEEPNFITGKYKYPSNTKELILNVTVDSIFNILQYKKIESISKEDILFDIPENLLSMYQSCFSTKNPIRIMPHPENIGEYRHIIYFNDMILVAFSLRNIPNKLYGFTYCDVDKDGNNSRLFEFSGNPMYNYKFDTN